jgi:hypothetical protein
MTIKINNYEDRKNVVIGLINSGYKVWVEEIQGHMLLHTDYIIHIEETKDKSIFDDIISFEYEKSEKSQLEPQPPDPTRKEY